MKTLKEQLTNKSYLIPHKFSFITLEEFCELNNINENNISNEQIEYFYEHYGEKRGLPASKYDFKTTHNDWIVENLKSHNHSIVVNRIKKLLGTYILNIDTEKLSEKYTNARIIRIALDKKCDIINTDSEKTFNLKNCELSDKLYNILNFHNYYITLIYRYDYENVIILEPKYTDEATNFVKENRYIYHITNKDNLENILKKGLRPKAKKNNSDEIYRYFIDRVYFTVHSTNIKQDLTNVINDLGYTVYSDEYVILKIDIKKLNITFWWDDASQGTTVYTYESIHPKFINVIDFDNI